MKDLKNLLEELSEFLVEEVKSDIKKPWIIGVFIGLLLWNISVSGIIWGTLNAITGWCIGTVLVFFIHKI